MGKKILWLGLAVVFIFSLNGCSTTRKNDELLNQGLRNRVIFLESQINEKDNEIESLKEALSRSSESAGESLSEIKPTNLQIQTALKNAGYYQGAIDGKLGKNSRQAIKDFQKANNLRVDGKVGKVTWAALKAYLDKKVK